MNISTVGLRVLTSFMASPSTPLHGYDLMRAAKVSSGTLYPLLLRFEREGLLTSKWEEVDAKEEGRPRRRLYTITGSGQRAVLEHLQQFGARWAPT